MDPFLLMIACLVAVLLVWGLMSVGAKRRTAGWAWALVMLFAAALVVEVVSMRTLGTNAKAPFATPPRQAEGKQRFPVKID